MLLAIDISNTTIKAGIFDGESMIAFWQVATERHKIADDYAMLFLSLFHASGINIEAIKGVSISCVVPRLRSVFEKLAMKYLHVAPFIVGFDKKIGIRLAHD